MKLRSYYTLALLLSCAATTIVLRADEVTTQEQGTRSGSVLEAQSMAELKSIIANNANVVVDVYGSWCGPCKKMAPEFAKLPGTFSNIVFVKIEVEQVDNSFGNIRSVPTLICFKNGQKVNVSAGSKSFNELQKYVSSIFQ